MKYSSMSRRGFVGILSTFLATRQLSIFTNKQSTDIPAIFIVKCPRTIESEYPEHNSILQRIDQKFIEEHNLKISMMSEPNSTDYLTYSYHFKNEGILQKWAALIQRTGKAAPLQKLNRSEQYVDGKKAIVFIATA